MFCIKISLLIVYTLLNQGQCALVYFRNIELPGKPHDIEGGVIVGQFWDSSKGYNLGYLHQNGITTVLDAPGSRGTVANGVSGNLVVGRADFDTGSKGYLYNNGSFTFVERGYVPFRGTAKHLQFTGVYDDKIVGVASSIVESPGAFYQMSFVYHNGVFTDVYSPYQGSQVAHNSSYAVDIEHNTFLGNAQYGMSSNLKFTKDLATGVYSDHFTVSENANPVGISDGKILVNYRFNAYDQILFGNDRSGYEVVTSTQRIDDGSSQFTGYTFPVENASEVEMAGVDGTTVVGSYKESGVIKYFIASVPEPSALSFLVVGLGGMVMIRRRRS